MANQTGNQWKPPTKRRLVGKLSAFGVVGLTLLAMYPIFISPYLHPEYWQKLQKEGRKGIDQEKIQPGDMKVWTDPFDRKKS